MIRWSVAGSGFNIDKFMQQSDLVFVVADDIEVGFRNKIPLGLFGFMY